jgi:hypothetical protein
MRERNGRTIESGSIDSHGEFYFKFIVVYLN